MSALQKMSAGVVIGSVVAGGVLMVPTTATAGTKPPPCSTKAVKKALKSLVKTLPAGSQLDTVTKVCSGYWAGGGFMFSTPDGGSGSGAYLLQASGGKWKYVPYAKQVKLCDGGMVPKRVAAKACLLGSGT